MEEGYQIIRISEQEYRTAISREHKLSANFCDSIPSLFPDLPT
jgi:hypothetical protein